MEPRRLYRSADDRWIGGVAAGVAEYFDVDPVIVRILWLISMPISGGLTLLAYLVMLVAVPLGPDEWTTPSPWAPGGAPIGTAPGGTPQGPTAAGSTDAGSTDPNATQTATPGATPGAAAYFGSTPGTAPMGTPPPTASAYPNDRWQRRQERWQRCEEHWQRRADAWQHRAEHRGGSGLIFGALLVLVGGVLAWKEVFPSFPLDLAWPTVIIVFGAILIVSSVGFGRRD